MTDEELAIMYGFCERHPSLPYHYFSTEKSFAVCSKCIEEEEKEKD